jgi:hypothetical protein
LAKGFKKQNGIFVLTKKVRRDNGFCMVMVNEIVAEVTLDADGYLKKASGLEIDNQGHLVMYRRF